MSTSSKWTPVRCRLPWKCLTTSLRRPSSTSPTCSCTTRYLLAGTYLVHSLCCERMRASNLRSAKKRYYCGTAEGTAEGTVPLWSWLKLVSIYDRDCETDFDCRPRSTYIRFSEYSESLDAPNFTTVANILLPERLSIATHLCYTVPGRLTTRRFCIVVRDGWRLG